MRIVRLSLLAISASALCLADSSTAGGGIGEGPPHRTLGDESKDEDEPIEVTCDIDLIDARRPMMTEKEIRSFKKCFEEATEEVEGGKAGYEYIEILGQTSSRRRELGQRRLGKTTTALTRAKCRRCGKALLSTRRLRGGGRRLQTAFEANMHMCLTSLDTQKLELQAFDNLGGVERRCQIAVHAPPIADVLGENNHTEVEKEQMCTTVIKDVTAPMLSEAEMAHYDHCYIKTYNEYHSVAGYTCIENEVVEQDLRGVDYRNRELTAGEGQGERRLPRGRKNTVLSKRGICRKCGSTTLSTRGRELRELGDPEVTLQTFDESLCECLKDGTDHRNDDLTYAAFEGPIACDTQCDAPFVTQQQFEVVLQSQEAYFEESKTERRDREEKKWARKAQEIRELEQEYDEEIEELKHKYDTEIEGLKLKLRLEKEKFEYEEKVTAIKFMQYQQQEEEAFLTSVSSSCATLVDKTGCDGMDEPRNVFEIRRPEDFSVKFTVRQTMNANTWGKCVDKDTEVPIYARVQKKTVGEYSCEGEKRKCDHDFDATAEYCEFDDNESKMLTTVDIMVSTSFLNNSLPNLAAKDTDKCLDAMSKAEHGEGWCHLKYSVDCGCKAIDG